MSIVLTARTKTEIRASPFVCKWQNNTITDGYTGCSVCFAPYLPCAIPIVFCFRRHGAKAAPLRRGGQSAIPSECCRYRCLFAVQAVTTVVGSEIRYRGTSAAPRWTTEHLYPKGGKAAYPVRNFSVDFKTKSFLSKSTY